MALMSKRDFSLPAELHGPRTLSSNLFSLAARGQLYWASLAPDFLFHPGGRAEAMS